MARGALPVSWYPVLMPTPGPLGHLVRRRRDELKLTQKELNERTRKHGFEFGQNNISRLESGVSQRVNEVARLTALAKALEFENYRDFIMAAFGPKDAPPERDEEPLDAPEAAMIELIHDWPEHEKWRAVRVVTALFDPPTSS